MGGKKRWVKKLEERSLEKLCTLPMRKKPRTAKSCTSDMLNLFRSEVEVMVMLVGGTVDVK